MPAWHCLEDLAARTAATSKDIPAEEWVQRTLEAYPMLAPVIQDQKIGKSGVHVAFGDRKSAFDTFDGPAIPPSPENQWTLICVDLTFGTEELSLRSGCLQSLETDPAILIQTADAATLGLADQDTVVLTLDPGELTVKARVIERMARGIMILPRHRRLQWQCLPTGTVRVKKDQISRASEGESC